VITQLTDTPGPTQPPTLSGTGNAYRVNCGDAPQLGVKAGMARTLVVTALDSRFDGRKFDCQLPR